MGEKGRLQTSPLQRLVPGYGDIRLTVKSMESQVLLEQAVTIKFQLTNARSVSDTQMVFLCFIFTEGNLFIW